AAPAREDRDAVLPRELERRLNVFDIARDDDADGLHLIHRCVGRIEELGGIVEANVPVNDLSELAFEVVHAVILLDRAVASGELSYARETRTPRSRRAAPRRHRGERGPGRARVPREAARGEPDVRLAGHDRQEGRRAALPDELLQAVREGVGRALASDRALRIARRRGARPPRAGYGAGRAPLHARAQAGV